MVDSATGRPHVPNGSLGFRFNESGMGKWNLDLEGVDPALSLYDAANTENVEVLLPRFDADQEHNEGGSSHRRGVPTGRITTADGERVVTTVFDLMLAQYGVGRDGLPGEWPTGYDDPAPYTPAWQEEITGVPAAQAERIGREFAQNAEDSGGRSMIILGAGTNHWFHSDTIYRTFLALITLTGCQGVNGGGWAHYVGQEKCRPVTGWANLAFGMDWHRPARQMIGTAFWYVQTDQWRYDAMGADMLASPLGEGRFQGRSMMDTVAQSARSGWMPSFPSLNRNPLDIAREAQEAGVEIPAYITEQLKSGDLRFAIEDPDAPENWPACSPSGGRTCSGRPARATSTSSNTCWGPTMRCGPSRHRRTCGPRMSSGAKMSPDGKLDLLISIDFRMTSTGLFGDILLPAATWYEKHDLSSTDMHPYVHAFTPAIDPPWETRSDYDIFQALGRRCRRWRPVTWVPRWTSRPSRSCTTPPTRWRSRVASSGLEDRRGRPDPRCDRAQVHPGRTRLHRDRRQDGRARPAAGHRGHHDQGRGGQDRSRGRGDRPDERRDPRRPGRRTSRDHHRRTGV